MEPTGACSNEEWVSSLSGIFSNFEADHFMAHLYGANNEYNNTFRNNGMTSSNFLTIDESSVNINDNGCVNLYNFTNSFPSFQNFSEENSYSSGSNSPFFPTHSYENNHFFSDTNEMQVFSNNPYELTNISSEGFFVPNFPHHVMEENFVTKTELVNHENPENDIHQASTIVNLGEELKLKRKNNVQEHETSGDEKMNELVESPKKKPRLPRDAQKGKRNALSKKNKKTSLDGTNEEKSGTKNAQDHPNSCSSEDDNSNIASQDSKGKDDTALNSSGKTRACRGAATDPQSLYARRRRERINERLRILQNLVPNGTKVDISTMLEEAVQYVKFLQLQIKLLSSDELWMFAPIAYNGMDMGLYEKLSI